MEAKKCNRCGCLKPLTEFHLSKNRPDGHYSLCKECVKKKGKVFRESSKGREYRRRWFSEHPEEPDRHQGRIDKWRAKHPGAIEAHRAVWWAANKQGRLPKPTECLCEKCGQGAQIYHHPNGYTDGHKYDVIPLCHRCHKLLHLTD